MAVLQKIRGWGIWLSLIIAFALLLFLVDPTVISRIFGEKAQTETYGFVAGEEVTNQDFYDVYQNFRFSDREEGYNQAWQQIVYDRLLAPWYEKAGLRVSEAQVNDAIANASEEELAYWGEKALRKLVSENVNNSTYISLFNQTAFLNDTFLDRLYDDSNRTVTVNLLTLDAPIADVEVSDEEIEAAYKARKYGWAPRNSEVEVVNVHVYPSDADTLAAKAEYRNSYAEFCEAQNPTAFVRRNSDEAFREVRYYKEGELEASLNEPIFGQGLEKTDVIEDGYDLTSARVVSSETRSAAGTMGLYMIADPEQADSLLNVLNAGTATVDALVANHEASAYGTHPVSLNNTRANIGQGVQFDFGKDCLDQPVGQYAVKDINGVKFVYALTEKDAPVLVKQVAVYAKHIFPSKATFKAVSDSVKVFYAGVKTVDDLSGVGQTSFAKFTTSYDMTVYDTVNEYRTLEGTAESMKGLTKAVFEHKPGEVVLQNNQSSYDIFLVGIRDFRPEGGSSLEEVKDRLSFELRYRKAAKTRLDAVREQVNGESDFAAIAAKLETEPVNGKVLAMDDPRLIGAASALAPGEIGMIDGLNGQVYVFEVVSSDVRNTLEKDQIKSSYLTSEFYRFYQGEPIMYVYRINDVTDYHDRLY